MELDDILIHLGEDRSKYFNTVAPPIMQSSNFVFDTIEDMRVAFANELEHHIYTRGNNPTVKILREKLAALEKTEDALVTGSGAAAVSASIMANIAAGDHIICVQKPYSWTYKLITKLLVRFGVSHTFVDGRDISEIENAIRPETKVLYLESPNTLTFEVQDLKACSELANKNNVVTIIDNSHASPMYQNPATFGIDVVVHSATKYINGHSDVVAGVICGSKSMISKIFNSELMTLGLTISPHDASLIIRGLRTLPLRVAQSNKTAFIIAEYLFRHPKVEKMYFPLHPSFDQYELASKQMTGCGGLITIKLKADSKEAVMRFVRKIKRFLMAVSWGGYESLMIPSIAFHEIPGLPDSPIHWSMIRLYVGLESAEYLIEDLDSALDVL
ncbi:MAG: aminotransferase class I/II-fold pyridoxal phosphate-dependent enzyme [Saprospiraceae bacterium]